MKKKIKELREKYILNPAHFYVGYFSFGKEPKANFPIKK